MSLIAKKIQNIPGVEPSAVMSENVPIPVWLRADEFQKIRKPMESVIPRTVVKSYKQKFIVALSGRLDVVRRDVPTAYAGQRS